MSLPESICFSSATFETGIKSSLKELQERKNFCDVTIACENQQVEGHKAVLSGGSLLFKNILKLNPQSHPLIFLTDVNFSYLLKILDFMYQGEVYIDQQELTDFLNAANDLKVKGLTEDALKDVKQSKCFAEKSNQRKKQRLTSSFNKDVNVDSENKIVEGVGKLNDLVP